MANIILVHGMAANENSWFDVPTVLRCLKHNVIPVTLPGHIGAFLTPGDRTTTMADYVDSVVNKFPSSTEGVILIGHSMGGQVITHVAAEQPDQVTHLIYVAAMLPRDGDSANDIVDRSNFDEQESTIQLLPYTKLRPPVFTSQPSRPLDEKFKLPAVSDGTKLKEFKKIKRYYIRCKKDEVIPYSHQKIMTKEAGFVSSNIGEIDTDHIPQKSAPNELHNLLNTFIK